MNPPTHPTTFLTNGHIYTQDPANPRVAAIAIRDGVIVATDSDQALADLVRQGDEVIDLDSRCVLPGLVDAHVHLQWCAEKVQGVDLDGVDSLDAVLARVEARAAATPAGEWIFSRGWNQNLWPGGAFPSAADLDRVAPYHPTFLIAQSGHAAWINTLAMRLAGITPGRPDPPGGSIQRDARGQPTGILFEKAIRLIQDVIGDPPPAELANAMQKVISGFWAAGVTGVHCMDGWPAFLALEHLHARGELGLRVLKYMPHDHLDEIKVRGLQSGDGDEWLRIGGIKLYADGALGVRTAALLEPYEGESDNRGMLLWEEQALWELGRRANEAGLALAIHAIGDRSNQLVLDLLQTIPRLKPIPHRIEHVQLLTPSDLGRLAANGIVASVQPIHATSDIEMAERHWGTRTRYAYAYNTLLDHGTQMVFGSDAPVEPFEPLLGIHAAVTRRRLDGSPGVDGWHPEQRLNVPQAIAAYSLRPARLAGLDQRLGSLAPGKLADLVVLDRDIFDVHPMEIPTINVLGTMIAGRWVKPLG